MQIEPPVSLPPLEPPGEWSRFQGLWTARKRGLLEVVPKANSCRFSLPVSTMPARLSFSTTKASSSGTRSREKPEPPLVGMPAVS